MKSLARLIRAAALAAFFVFLLSNAAFAAVPQYVYFKNGGSMVKVDYTRAADEAMAGDNTLYNAVVQYVGEAELTGAPVIVETDTGVCLDYQKALGEGRRFADIVGDPAYRTGRPEAVRELRVENGRAVIVDIVPSGGLQLAVGGNLTAVRGGTLQVPVFLTSSGEVAGVQFDVLYDKNLLTFQGVSGGELVGGQDWLVSGNALDSAARVVVVSQMGKKIAGGSGTLAILTFRVAGSVPAGACSDLTLCGAVLSDAEGRELTGVGLVGGRFTAQ